MTHNDCTLNHRGMGADVCGGGSGTHGSLLRKATQLELRRVRIFVTTGSSSARCSDHHRTR